MTVIVNEVFNILNINYILLNMTDYEKCYYILKYLNNISVNKNKDLLSLLYNFKYNVLYEYILYLFGDIDIDDKYVFNELKESFHGEIVKQLIDNTSTIYDAIPMINLCLTLLRQIQHTKDEKKIIYYLTHNKNTVILITE